VAKISVVTVSFNSARTIGSTLDIVAAQRNADFEHIVVDGASTDGTREIVQAFRPAVAHLISEPDQGLYDAMNKGIAAASGEYLGFLNSDDVYVSRDVLAKVAQALSGGAFDAAYGDLLYVSADDPDRIVRYWQSRSYHLDLFRKGWHPAHPTLFVRTQLLRELGGFDTEFRYHADFDLMARLFVERGISSTYIPEVLVHMRMGGQSNRSIANIVRGNRESYRIARRAGIAASPLWFLSKLAYRIPQFFRRPPLP